MTDHDYFDCLVVGGGLIGMLSARELVQAGCRVGLVERGEAGRESTWAGGGILSPLYPWRYPDAVNALANWGQHHYAAFAERLQQESGIDPEYRQSGLLILDVDEQAAALHWAQRWQAQMTSIDTTRIADLEPALGEQAGQALWMPAVAQLRNPRLARACYQSIKNQGVTIFEQRAVSGLRHKDGRISGVLTVDGEIGAKQVIVAGGAWSAGLLEATGVQLPVRPVRGQMILYHAAPDQVKRIVLSRDRYVIPRRDGRVLVGSTLEETGFDKRTTQEALQALQSEAARLIPALADCPVEHHWAGLRPGSPAGIPYIGAHPTIEGLYINSGHFRNGVVLGLASARLLADRVLQRHSEFDAGDYVVPTADEHQANVGGLAFGSDNP